MLIGIYPKTKEHLCRPTYNLPHVWDKWWSTQFTYFIFEKNLMVITNNKTGDEEKKKALMRPDIGWLWHSHSCTGMHFSNHKLYKIIIRSNGVYHSWHQAV